MIIDILLFILGLIILIYLSPKVVNYSIKLGEIFHISPLIIGVIAVAIGTSLPEIANSITSSVLGHGDVNVGNIVGSALSNITLILGLCILIGGSIKIDKKDFLLISFGLILSTLFTYITIEKGFISRLNGLFLVITFIAIYYIMGHTFIRKEYIEKKDESFVFSSFWKKYSLFLGLSIIGIVVGSLFVVNSIISISETFGLPEFIVSFLAIGIGTSLPELFVGINAIKTKDYDILIGDIIGSNIADLTIALGIGPLFVPNIIESSLTVPFTGYLLIVSFLVILIFIIKKKITRKMSLLLILFYFLSFYII